MLPRYRTPARLVFALFLIGFGLTAHAAPAAFTLEVEGVAAGAPIPEAQALCVPVAGGKSRPVAAAQRPAFRWSGAPEGTRSFAVFMMDPDVPADFTDAGKEGKTIAETAKRQEFFHWGVVDIAPDVTTIAGGKADTALPSGRELPNSLGAAGYVPHPGQYGGPCPPWNDARIHHYHFIVLALDAPAPALPADTAKSAFDRLMASPHLLDKATVVGTYTLNAALRAPSQRR
ncbi:MAG: YbhB/YbcL family Raf kinase inhibitor-like protein [Alphaproteobacteria bacterium]|nr:YbhB/YbcL family Raf kinase inhibitor-like protein [Alphaproteobacteria bacterium]